MVGKSIQSGSIWKQACGNLCDRRETNFGGRFGAFRDFIRLRFFDSLRIRFRLRLRIFSIYFIDVTQLGVEVNVRLAEPDRSSAESTGRVKICGPLEFTLDP